MEQENRPLEPYSPKETVFPKIPESNFANSPLTPELHKNKLEEVRQVYEAVWRPLEPSIMSAFENVTHNKWKPHLMERGINISLTTNFRSAWHEDGNGTMSLNCTKLDNNAEQNGSPEWKGTYEILGSHLHELGHAIQTAEDKKFMREHFGNRVDQAVLENYPANHINIEDKKNRFLKDVYADVVSFAAAEKTEKFSPEQISQCIDNRKIASNGTVTSFIEKLSHDDKKAIMDKEFRATLSHPFTKTNGVEHKNEALHKKIASPIRRFFKRNK